MHRTLTQTPFPFNHQTILQFLTTTTTITRLPHLHQLHACMLKAGLFLHPFPSTKLLAAAALLDTAYAHSLLLHHLTLSPPSLFPFNSLLRGHSVSPNLQIHQPFSIFNSLRSLGLSPDQFSFIAILKCCARARSVDAGCQLHCSVLHYGHYLCINLRNTLISFYSACGETLHAQILFDEMPHLRDAVSWSVLMKGYLECFRYNHVLNLFNRMLADGFRINAAAIVCTVSTWISTRCCCCYGGRSMHGYCIKAGFCSDLNVGTAITTTYAKFGMLDCAKRMFSGLSNRDVVLYNCLVDGYARGGLIEESLSLLHQMKDEGVNPNSATLVGLLSACASFGALVVGRRVHEYAKQEKLELDANLGTAVVDMYVKCGCLEEAVEVFNSMKDRDVKAWTAMIMGLGSHGRAEEALRVFQEMEEEGMRPNEVTFLAVLSACSHGGMIASGKECFEKMVREYKMTPGIEHYGGVVDLLGRAGMLEEAHELIKSLPEKGDATAWRALLAASRAHGDVRIGELARQSLVAMGDEHPTDSILLSSVYAQSGRWEDVVRMRNTEGEPEKKMNKKEAGCSLIEMSNSS